MENIIAATKPAAVLAADAREGTSTVVVDNGFKFTLRFGGACWLYREEEDEYRGEEAFVLPRLPRGGRVYMDEALQVADDFPEWGGVKWTDILILGKRGYLFARLSLDPESYEVASYEVERIE